MYYANSSSNPFTNYNVAVGYEALRGSTSSQSNTGNANTALGYQTLLVNSTGDNNTATGYAALLDNTTGTGNSAYGFDALYNNTTGGQNTAMGYSAGNSYVAGDHNTFLGYNTDAGSNGLTNSTAIGNAASVNASNKVRIGNSAVTVIEGQVAYTFPSDGRFKTNIQEDVPGLEFITKLRPVTYTFETQKFDEFLNQNDPSFKERMNPADYAASSSIIQSGFIAQEVEKTMQEIGYNFNGVHHPESEIDNYGMSYELIVVPLVKAVQELNLKMSEFEDLKMENEKMKSELVEIESLKAEVEELKLLMEQNGIETGKNLNVER